MGWSRADQTGITVADLNTEKLPRNLVGAWPWPLANVWLGVSVENQLWADRRIPLLLETPATVRFISAEPLLAETVLLRWLVPEIGGQSIDWVISGCESGPKHRPMELDWARSIRDQCVAAGVSFFLKQAYIGGRFTSMPELDGQVWSEIPS